MPVPPAILDLVERFERQLDSYKSGHYNETQLRREFLDPFFKTLGWDMDNEQGYAEAYKDVVHEDAIRIGDHAKAPDYCFRIGGARKFFLEAKKPSVAVKEDIGSAYQLRSYTWSAKLSLGILSDFEEFAVYDGRIKPGKNDSAATARVFYWTFREYTAKWDEIAAIFSREAVLKGSFDKFAESTKAKKGTAEFDEDFLATIEGWRKELAQNLALRNRRLTHRELNFAVQRIIDRIIFLRICEARGLEDYGRLLALTSGDRIYPRLGQLFEAADARYNSGLFHFRPEPGRHEPPDEFTLSLDLDDKLLRDMLRGLYYPESPYRFSVISADILGHVYEQFLGKVIRLTEGHHAVVEDKPEVKKAGGVYYTPTYIVDYIVKNTVGKLLDGINAEVGRAVPSAPSADDHEGGALGTARPTSDARKPAAILNRASKLRILDPACGSGSFLIGAYQFLLDWHLDFYVNEMHRKDAEVGTARCAVRSDDSARPAVAPYLPRLRGKSPIYQSPGGGWRLTIDERKRILVNNIFGVDIDAQAVETTKLSLLLKVLEGETGQTLQTIFTLFHERALPDLADNIKCGNSLIGPDFYAQPVAAVSDRRKVESSSTSRRSETAATGVQLLLLDAEEKLRINVFDWKKEFADIFQAGGFDVVIGNPPYIRIQTMQDSQPQEVEFFSHAYKAASQGNYDIYVVFVERGLQLLNKSGRQGFILPNKFFRTDYGEGLRRVLSDSKAVSKIVDFGHSQVFKATTYTCLLFLEGGKANSFDYAESEAAAKALSKAVFAKRESKSLTAAAWTFESVETASFLDKLGKRTTRLLDVPANMSRGSSTGDDEVFVFESGTLKIEKEILREPIFASDFGRYRFAPSGKWKVIFPYVSENGVFRLYTEQELKRLFPRAYAYLHENQQALKRRKQFKEWFGYSAPRNLALHDQAQIAVPLLADGGLFAFIPNRTRGQLCPMASGGFTITLSKQCPLKPEYVLGLLNSKLLFWRLQGMSNLFRGGWITCTKQYFGELPIRMINFADADDKAAHDRMVKLVEQMLALHPRLAAAKTPPEKTALERQIAATDAQIDRLVYDLYGLTAEEIKIVEGRAK